MSYSFSVQAASKAEAIQKVAAQMAEVVKSQPVHQSDEPVVVAAAESFVSLLRDDDSQEVSVGVSGSVWASEHGLNSAAVNISAALVSRSASSR